VATRRHCVRSRSTEVREGRPGVPRLRRRIRARRRSAVHNGTWMRERNANMRMPTLNINYWFADKLAL